MGIGDLEDLRRQFEAARDAMDWDLAAELSEQITNLELEKLESPVKAPSARFWVEPAWQQLVTYCESNGVMLGQAYQRDLESAGSGVEASGIRQAALVTYKTIMAGYWLISNSTAPDTVVDQVYAILKRKIHDATNEIETVEGMPLDQFIDTLRTEEGRQGTIYDIGYLGASLRLQSLKRHFIDGYRADKVIAIDAVMHMAHEEGMMIVLLIGYGVRGEGLDAITEDALIMLAEKNWGATS